MSYRCFFFVLLMMLAYTAGASPLEQPMNISDTQLISDEPVNSSGVLISAPLNPAFVRYQTLALQNQASGDDGHRFGDNPSPVYRPEVVDGAMEDLALQEFPETYDLRDEGKVSQVRDQGDYNTCWTFAALSSLESNLLPEKPFIFSPKNMANLHGFDGGYNGGGGVSMATAYLTRWNGPVLEETDPYPATNWTDSAEYPPVVHVQQVIEYPSRSNRTDTNGIKAGLVQWGAAYVGMYYDPACYNRSSASYYLPASSLDSPVGGGHGVTLVGWNDTFPASAFNETPPADGAWIVKNSWGTGWGDEGYFHVSYYDKYFCSAVPPKGEYRKTGFFTGEPVETYDQIYLHDPLGNCEDYYAYEPKTGTVAARYNVTAPGILSAIGFYTTDVQTRYEAIIYRNPTDGPVGEEVGRLEGNLTTMGYHTLPLPQESRILVTEGESFAIVLRLENRVHPFPLAIEEPIPEYSSNATAGPGESYYAPTVNGPFYDLIGDIPNASVCVRAYTESVPVPTPTPSVLDASFTATPEQGPAPLTVRFTDTSTGDPSRWVWNFGFGPQSALQNPEVTYTEPGVYSVSLIIGKGQDVDREYQYRLITVENQTESELV